MCYDPARLPACSCLQRRLMEMGFSERVAKKALEMSDQNLEAAFEMCLGRSWQPSPKGDVYLAST